MAQCHVVVALCLNLLAQLTEAQRKNTVEPSEAGESRSEVPSSTLPITVVGNVTTIVSPVASSSRPTGTSTPSLTTTLSLPTTTELSSNESVATLTIEATVSSKGKTTSIRSSDKSTSPPTVPSSEGTTVRSSDLSTFRTFEETISPPTIRSSDAPTTLPTVSSSERSTVRSSDPSTVLASDETTISSTIAPTLSSSDEPTSPPTVRSTVRASPETTIPSPALPNIRISDEPTLPTTTPGTPPVTFASVSTIQRPNKSTVRSTDLVNAQPGRVSLSTTSSTEATVAVSTVSRPRCGPSKGCYSWCPRGDCRFNLTVEYQSETLLVEMSSRIPSTGRHWIALGLSSDRAMDDDSVMECVMVGERVEAFTSYNDGYSNVRIGQTGISYVSGRVEDGVLGCTFQRSLRVNSDPRIFDLTNQSAWYLFLASGTMDGNTKRQHTATPHVSDGKVDLRTARDTTEMEDIPTPGRRMTMIKVHGSLMLIAWVFCTSVGIIVARYYKLLGGQKTCYNDRYSFHVHRASMTITLVCVIVSVVLIFVEVNGYSKIHSSEGLLVQAHPILGIIVTSLVLINFSMGLLRPAPGRAVRPVYNWGHWATGSAAWIAAIVAIFMGFAIERASVHPAAKYVLLGFVTMHLLLQLFLEWLSCYVESPTLDRPDHKPPEKYELQTLDRQNDRKSGMFDPQQKDVEGVGKLKATVLFGYVLAQMFVLIALLILVNMQFET